MKTATSSLALASLEKVLCLNLMGSARRWRETWYTWSHIQRLSEDLGKDTCLTTCSAPRANNGVKNQLPQVVHLTAMFLQ